MLVVVVQNRIVCVLYVALVTYDVVVLTKVLHMFEAKLWPLGVILNSKEAKAFAG